MKNKAVRQWFECVLLAITAALFIAAVAPTGFAHPRLARGLPLRTNPPVAHTGGFGEPTCRYCHSFYELNDSAGALLIDGLPERYQAGERYRLTLTVRHPSLVVAGFQVSTRYEAGVNAGKQAGELIPVDTLATVTSDSVSRVKFLHHTAAGVTTGVVRGTAKWSFDWIAPRADSGTVVLHASGNAGNDDFSELGDYVFTKALRSGGGGSGG